MRRAYQSVLGRAPDAASRGFVDHVLRDHWSEADVARELRKSDLEGSAGIYRLKEELRRRINVAIFPAQVDAILFKELLVQ